MNKMLALSYGYGSLRVRQAPLQGWICTKAAKSILCPVSQRWYGTVALETELSRSNLSREHRGKATKSGSVSP